MALDIEVQPAVPSSAERSRRLIQLSDALRAKVTGRPLGAIVLAPVLMEAVNPQLWPSFPWRRLTGDFDAWLPMVYWTDRRAASIYRDPARYTDENLRRLRADLGATDARIHAIGGVGDRLTTRQCAAFGATARRGGTIGLSIYDFVSVRNPACPLASG